MKKLISFFAALVAGAYAIFAIPASAYDVSPIVVQLAPSGPGASGTMVITNSHEQPIAIEVFALKRVQKPDGSEDRTPEDQDIIITPPQMVIAPGASQSVRLRWIGESNPESELAYRIITEQLPINLGRQQSGEAVANLNFAYRYEAALYIVPPGSTPSARITRAAPVTGEDGNQWLELDIASEGTRRAILDRPAIILTPQSGGEGTRIEGDLLRPLVGLNVLSGGYRTVRIPWPEGVSVGPVQAQLETEYTVFQ